MKTWIKILLGVVVVFVLAIGAVFYFTSGMVDTADAFFKAARNHNIEEARSYLSEDFRASTDKEDLSRFLVNKEIANFTETNWASRKISGGRGELDGSITTSTGGVVPIKMMFIKENDAWKIYAIQKPTAGLQSEESSPSIPGKDEQISLVRKSMHDFIVSVNHENMEHFRSGISNLWKKQITTEQLNKAFKSVIDSGANWSVLESVKPTISDATIDDNGILALAGTYQTQPSIIFNQKYIYEGLAWKLVGFSIHTK
ncbi:MAG: hypothetical protein PVJ40_08845 [Gammaproteobacteria bacterium]|jgi:hypothetical protein